MDRQAGPPSQGLRQLPWAGWQKLSELGLPLQGMAPHGTRAPKLTLWAPGLKGKANVRLLLCPGLDSSPRSASQYLSQAWAISWTTFSISMTQIMISVFIECLMSCWDWAKYINLLIYSYPETVITSILQVKNPKFRKAKLLPKGTQSAGSGSEMCTHICPTGAHTFIWAAFAGGRCKRMFCKAPTFKLSHPLPETFCKHAEAKLPSFFLLPSRQVAWPTAIWQSGPQGQNSSLSPLMALRKDNGQMSQRGPCACLWPSTFWEGAGRRKTCIEHLLYGW